MADMMAAPNMYAEREIKQEDISANNTLYVNNLNEKIKIEELRNSLTAVFQTFGEILSVMCFRTLRMRGQAHVIFQDVDSAIKAKEALNGFPFYEKRMRIEFARQDSDVISKVKGTYVERVKEDHTVKIKRKRRPARDGEAPAPPNKILFCTNLPDDTNESMLQILFSQFDGLRDIRMVPNRPGIAFVEFADETLSQPAKLALNNFKISPEKMMRVDYAKK